MKNLQTFNQFINEGAPSQFGSKEEENLRMIQAKWSNAVLAKDASGMEKYMKDLVKANDALIKYIKK